LESIVEDEFEDKMAMRRGMPGTFEKRGSCWRWHDHRLYILQTAHHIPAPSEPSIAGMKEGKEGHGKGIGRSKDAIATEFQTVMELPGSHQ
jgi:hypothetical protein